MSCCGDVQVKVSPETGTFSICTDDDMWTLPIGTNVRCVPNDDGTTTLTLTNYGQDPKELLVPGALTPSQIADALGFLDCSGQPIVVGSQLATCQDLNTALISRRIRAVPDRALVEKVDTDLAGDIIQHGADQYMCVPGADVIPDKPDLIPLMPYSLRQWGIIEVEVCSAATVDNTLQLQAALDYVRGELPFYGWVKVTDNVHIPRHCKVNAIPGRECGGISVFPDFNMDAAGVVTMGDSQHCPTIGQFGFWFQQPEDATQLSDLIQYPPAVYLGDNPRPRIEAMRISNGWDGIVIDGNAGGARFELIESGCHNRNMYINGPLDFFHIDSYQVWPFGVVGQPDILDDFYANNIGLEVVNCDGFVADKISIFRGKVLFGVGAAGSLIPYTVNSLQLDGDGSDLTLAANVTKIGSLYLTRSNVVDTSITVTGGRHFIDDINTAGAAEKYIDVNQGALFVNGGEFQTLRNDNVLATVQNGGGRLHLTQGVSFNWPATGRAVPLVEQFGTGILRFEAWAGPKGPLSNGIVRINQDNDNHYVDMTRMYPHTLDRPADSRLGQYFTRDISRVPVTTFATPGDYAENPVTSIAAYRHDGHFGNLSIRMVFAPTFTTASGAFQITIPDFSMGVSSDVDIPVAIWQGLNFTGNRNQLAMRVYGSDGRIELLEFGVDPPRIVDHTNFVSGQAVVLTALGSPVL